jgi:hypothetical protein
MALKRKPLLGQAHLKKIVWDELQRFKACQSITAIGIYLRDHSVAGTWRIGTVPNRDDFNQECSFIVRDVEERLGKLYDLGPED